MANLRHALNLEGAGQFHLPVRILIASVPDLLGQIGQKIKKSHQDANSSQKCLCFKDQKSRLGLKE